jgi:hypothetical protein
MTSNDITGDACNLGLGAFKESPDSLRGALGYLAQHRKGVKAP